MIGNGSLAHELASVDNSTNTPESVSITTYDINEASVGNNAHPLLVGNQTGAMAQQFINDKVIPFAHGGHNDLGVHAEYLFELPSPE